MRGPREGSSSLSKPRRNASATSNISSLATPSTPTNSEMSSIPILVHHNGEWDQSFNFTNYTMKGAILKDGCNFQGLVDILTKILKINQTETTMEIRYQLKHGYQPIEIEDDDSLLFYLEMKKKDNDVTNLPLCVTTQQKQLQLILHPSTSVAISSQRVASESSETKAASESSETRVASESSETVAEKEIVAEKKKVAEKPLIDTKLLEAISDIIEYGKLLSKRVMEAENKEEEEEEEEDKEQEKEIVISDTMQTNVEVGQIYKDKETLKSVLSFYAIRNNFQYKVTKSCSKEYTLTCYDKNCHWSLRASRKAPANTFIIRKFNNVHTCPLEVRLDNQRQATSNVIGERIKEKYLDGNNNYKPKDIVRDMKENYGISLSYQKAWRSKEKALENLRGKEFDSYKMLPSFMYMLTTTNPGSIVEIKILDDCSFQYAFMAIDACIKGWKYCRPVMVVEGIFLKARYGGTLLTATAEDASGKIFPLAFAIVDFENDDSWEWFFTQMRETFGVREGMCIISDWDQSIEKASTKVFPEASHGICLYHLLNNLKIKFEKSDSEIKDAFFGAARAYTTKCFEYHMYELEKIDKSIPPYLEEIGYHKWARAHCISNRYKTMASNMVKSLKLTKKEAKKLPVTTLLSFLHGLVQERTSENRKIACQTSTMLTKKAEDMLNKNYLDSLNVELKEANTELYSVLHNEQTYTVNLKDRSCTCNKFQIDEIPCCHAVAILKLLQQDCYEYCSEYHKRDTMAATYESIVLPIPNNHTWDIPEEIKQIIVLPPRRRVGRPRKRKSKAARESRKRNKCGICEQKGHNKKTCKNMPNASDIILFS